MTRWKPFDERSQSELIEDLRGLGTVVWDVHHILLSIYATEYELDNPVQVMQAINRLETCLVAIGLYHDKLPHVVKKYLQEVGESDGTL